MNQHLSKLALILMIILVGASLLFGATPAQAAVFEVPCAADASAALSAAIQAANDTPGHDTIRLAEDCDYVLDSVQYIDALLGPNGLPLITESLTIEGNGAQLRREFNGLLYRYFLTAPNVALAISDMRILGGHAPQWENNLSSGGAILARGPLTLTDIYFGGNVARGSGGAVFSSRNILSVSNTTFDENDARDGSGGAIFSTGSLFVNNSEFISNSALVRGGAIANLATLFAPAPSANIQNSLFEGNTMWEPGGEGGALSMEASLTLSSSEFVGNEAYYGGAIHFLDGNAGISGSTFDRNAGLVHGGAIYAANASLSLQQSSFVDTTGGWMGATLYLEPADNSTNRIINNLMTGDFCEDDTATITIVGTDVQSFSIDVVHNTIVYAREAVNVAVDAIDVDDTNDVLIANNIIAGYEHGIQITDSELWAGYNLYYHMSGPYHAGSGGIILPFEGGQNLNTNPHFVDANTGDYRIRHTSPGVDSAFDLGVNVDLLGVFRPQQEDPDRGAYEYINLNTPPVAEDDLYVTTVDTRLVPPSPGLLANDSDADGDTLHPRLESGPSHASNLVINANGSFTYVPEEGFVGEDSFTYRAYDGVDESNVATVTITVEAANEAPEAAGDAYETPEDTPLTIAAPGVLDNDEDADGDTLSAILQSQPSHGSVTLNANGSFNYTPDGGYSGNDSFTYRASDGEDESEIASVSITVTPVNEPPVATGDAYNVLENTTLTIAPPGVLDNDSDADGDALGAVLESQPQHGSLSFDDGGGFSYTPDAGYTGADSFTYRAFDGEESSNVATVTMNVLTGDANLPPVAFSDAYTTSEDTTLAVAAPGILENDSDANGDALAAVLETGPAQGTLTLEADGSFSYAPDGGFAGADSFTYRAVDGEDESEVATVRITVEVLNAPPTAEDDAYDALQDTTLHISAPGVLDNDSDPDGDTLRAIVTSPPVQGSLILNEDGGFSYTPQAGFVGEDSFGYVVDDGLEFSDAAVVTISVVDADTNVAPVAAGDAYATSQDTTLSVDAPGVLGNDGDANGDALGAVLDAAPQHGSLTLNDDGSFTYVPDPGFVGQDSFTYVAFDGQAYAAAATVGIDVHAQPDAFHLFLPLMLRQD